ncbi:hypothetical protein TRAPUB_14060 [Trametes pubescens]|uniref:BTB domain-containing protein n=1 Tax=Trametes pubescens TaxID=154538 RepID=A0A1M2VPD8_TRAPU|nr:hypothetical protein TRAPUB_14060 [Trametes pubescens]
MSTLKRARRDSTDGSFDGQDGTQQGPEDSAAFPESTRTLDEEFWYGDGNIILLAGDVEFRVYMGLLAENSPVLRDLYYTNDFDVWDKHTDYCPPGFEDVHSIGVVNLAHLTGETSLLPTALLACCQLGQRIVNGFEREDGTHEHLTLGDVSLCHTARKRLIYESTRMACLGLRPMVSDECKTAAVCKRGFKRLLDRIEADVSVIVGMDPFQCKTAFEEDVYQEDDLCKACRAVVDDHNDRERCALWNRLPEILGIAEPGPGGAEEGSEAVGAT